MDCWIGALTFEACCPGPWGVGNVGCWDNHFTWSVCCEPQLAAEYEKAAREREAEREAAQAEASARRWPASPGAPRVPLPDPLLPVTEDERERVVDELQQCIDQYDDHNYRQWFISQSGIITHPFASLGNPAACVDGGHHFYWVLLSVRVATLDSPQRMPDTGLQFGICVPARCHGHAVTNLLVPFYMGPYLGKSWGPRPVWLERFAKLQDADDFHARGNAAEPSFRQWATEVAQRRAFFDEEFPFPLALWQYERYWYPSRTNSAVLLGLAFLPCAAGVCAAVPKPVRRLGAASHRGRIATVWSDFLEAFAPQRCIARLCAQRDDDAGAIHVTRCVLQGLVCFQHAVFLVDWFGNEGHDGLSAFAPLIWGLAQVLGRVNTTFACLSAHLVAKSVSRALGGAAVATHAQEAAPNGKASGGSRTTARARSGGCVYTLAMWCTRRWLFQVSELALWTFYYLQVSRDVPWRPFPEFVNVWYQSRIELCTRWPKGGLPMWLMSSMLVYEPLNNFFGWHDHKLSVCHNLQIFETLFALSCAVAAAVAVRHRCGSRAFLALAAGLVAASVARMPLAERLAPAGDEQDFSDWRWNILPQTLPRLLSASLITAVLSCEGASVGRLRRRRGLWGLAVALLLVTFALDFLVWGQGHISHNWRVEGPLYRFLFEAWGGLMKGWQQQPQLQRLLTWSFELPHVLGMALLLRLGEEQPAPGVQPAKGASCVVLLSRLSLGVNISNIFALHYISARLHDYPVEFSHLNLAVYSLIAWAAATGLAVCSHCLTAPYASLIVGVCRRATSCKAGGAGC